MKQITLNIGGQDRVFYFGLGFLGNLLEVENIQFHEIDLKIKENPFKWTYLIMYHSLAFGFIRQNEEIPFSKFDVSDWIDNCEDFETIEVEVLSEKTQRIEKTTQQVKIPVSRFFKAFKNSLDTNLTQDKKKVKAK